MTVTFYRCTADHRLVDKTSKMTQIFPATIEAINDVDIITPRFTVAYNSDYVDHEDLSSINYFKIDELSRYYFILDMVEQAGTTLLIDALCDVRMSFIKDNDFEVVVIKNEKIKNSRIIDKSLPIDPQYHEPEVLPLYTDLFEHTAVGSHITQPRWYDIIETI